MFVIHNPTAGRRNARRLDTVLDCLRQRGQTVHVLRTRHGGHAADLAREAVERGADMVVAAGGDGTIAETVAGMIGATARLGVIPLGTANVLAHEFRLPETPAAIADILMGTRSARLWPGIVRSGDAQRPFVQMVGAGFDAHVVHRIDLGLKRRFGRAAYVGQTLRELSRYRYPRLNVRVDGVAYEAASMIASKGRLYGGPYLLAPDARPGEPGFAITLFDHGGPLAALRAGAALPLGRLGRMRGVTRLRGREIEITSRMAAPVQADGDPAGLLAISIHDASAPVMLAIG